MKRMTALLLTLLMAFLTVCGGTPAQNNPPDESNPPISTPADDDAAAVDKESEPTARETRNIPVAYVSHTGNTEVIAGMVAEQTGSDLFHVETTTVYPNWWGTMPMTMFAFLESYDFSGKAVVPFCTHEGSALGSSESDIAELIPDAELLDGLAVRGQTAHEWLGIMMPALFILHHVLNWK